MTLSFAIRKRWVNRARQAPHTGIPDDKTLYAKHALRHTIALKWLAAALLGLVCASSYAEKEMFEDTCHWEQFFVKQYKGAIGESRRRQKLDFESLDGIKKVTFATKDGGAIQGLVWQARRPEGKGYLLIAQGNAMMVAGIHTYFAAFRDIGLDVYLYDYRGYPFDSALKTSLAGIVSDYSGLIKELNAKYAGKAHYIYGISFGGLVLLNALDAIKKSTGEADGALSAAVFDSVPSKLSSLQSLLCPARINPANRLPAVCDDWLVIAGPDDRVVGDKALKFAEEAKKCGAATEVIPGAGHLFSGDTPETLRKRLRRAKDHFESLLRR